ncbi:hypothetical protein PRIPAC_76286 [Pristionchus pacificus]|uniref:Uncharacterized protein n=1 Tax=Pristionchus pacificus TaxID=54126 RepID=A0A2A6C573_PRIPA|nr:hypothetical protein PRIPAC_76286 [Pristionchus pacificus]|eukprot:PDM73289.1 hypothetical protein PRIPAC_40645 [Pristionchus pacificus]
MHACVHCKVLGPIATIDFKNTETGKSTIISGDYMSDPSAGADTSTIFVSPGYVGCESTKSSAYSLTPAFKTAISTFSAPSDSYGYTLQVRGNFSMYYQNDFIVITINGGVQNLSNSGSTSRSQSSASIAVQFDPTNTRNPDQFAFQFDVTSKAPVETSVSAITYYYVKIYRDTIHATE